MEKNNFGAILTDKKFLKQKQKRFFVETRLESE
jgi:hypothetical protein